MTLLTRWAAWAKADAAARNLPELAPVIDGLAASLARLRSIDWEAERASSVRAVPEQPPRA